MTQAVLPDGTILEFPDETPPDVIQGAVKRMLGVEPAPVEDIDALAAGEVAGIEELAAAEELASIEGVSAAEAMAAAEEIAVGEETAEQPPAMILPFRFTAEGEPFFDPDVGIMGAFKRSIMAPGEVLKGEFDPLSPEGLERAMEFAMVMSPAGVAGRVAGGPTIVGKAAKEVGRAAERQTARRHVDFVDDLVLPKATAAVRKEQVARTTEGGLLGKKQVALSRAEQQMADEVGMVPGVGASKTIQGNYNAISKEVTTEANKLTNLLAKNDVAIPRREFAAELERAVARLEENPLLVGDAAKTATKVVDKMKQIVDSNPGTASGLLKSRKELDAWIKTQKPKIFDQSSETALSIAIKEIRQSTNRFLDERAVDVAVKESLKKQSTLLNAMDNIAPKAAEEGGNAIMRAWQNVNQVIGLRGEFNQVMATAAGVGGLGAAAMFAPIFREMIVLGGLTYAGGKAILSPTAKKAVSALLKGIDKSIRTSKDETLISKLRLDRAAIAELLNEKSAKPKRKIPGDAT